MQIEDALSKSRTWINQLVGKELQYITGRNTSVINNVDWDDEGKIFVSRGEGQIAIRFERIAAVIAKLIKGHPVHVDTILRSGSNDRSVIETIIANFPPVGFMRPNQGRNKSKNKVIQWLCEDVHSVGVIKDISQDEFSTLSLSAAHIKNAQLLSKSFLLLAGISGTGKTRFVREQAKATGSLAETYCLTSVRPDWHEPSDLLGYISRLNGAAEYITTDVLQFIAKAWRGIADSGLSIEVQDIEEQGKRLVVTGECDALEQVLPYWLCLDEMNLAPVEQYFADYLSVLETREWRWADDSFTYSSDALLKPTTINDVADKDKLRKELGFGSEEYHELWDIICQYGLGIPFNLMVAGTVNMDETTHGFSRKVIDRALSFDFGEFFPNKTEDFFVPKHKPKALSYPLYSQAKLPMFASVAADSDASKTTAFFNAINAVLKQTPFELAFRAFNELCLAVISFSPKTELELTAVFDDFLMCKVLPRIEGDDDKLVGNSEQNLLEQLETVLADKLANIWQGTRPDLLREVIELPDETVMVVCRSAAKLVRMRKLLESGFTSFWP